MYIFAYKVFKLIQLPEANEHADDAANDALWNKIIINVRNKTNLQKCPKIKKRSKRNVQTAHTKEKEIEN